MKGDSEEVRATKSAFILRDKVSPGEMCGYQLYSRFKYHAQLNESVRLSNQWYVKFNLAAASYKLSRGDVTEFNNKFCATQEFLHTTP